MRYSINQLLKANDCQKQLKDGRYVPARPENYKYRSFKQKIKDAIDAFRGKVDLVEWEEQ